MTRKTRGPGKNVKLDHRSASYYNPKPCMLIPFPYFRAYFSNRSTSVKSHFKGAIQWKYLPARNRSYSSKMSIGIQISTCNTEQPISPQFGLYNGQRQKSIPPPLSKDVISKRPDATEPFWKSQHLLDNCCCTSGSHPSLDWIPMNAEIT